MARYPNYNENIFEELDAPGEWYLDENTNTVYVYPKKGHELNNAKIETVRLKHLIHILGTEEKPVKHVHIKEITFTHTKRTFMETREPLLRSDWMIYRGGAIYIEGAKDCHINGCFIDQIGGNGIFASGYNRRINISSCHIAKAGATAIAFVGKPDCVRSPYLLIMKDKVMRRLIEEADQKVIIMPRNVKWMTA